MAASQVVDQSMHDRDSDESCETELAKALGNFKTNLKNIPTLPEKRAGNCLRSFGLNSTFLE